ncbi:MAG TPA: hypothetical protein VLZ33_06930, partial [Dysgonamonadaceae bacterium]|nr:hypothetical protein [Dysgonamonadaceae bacterium]
MMQNNIDKIREYLGNEQDSLLNHRCEAVSKELLTHPGPNYVDEVFGISDRNVQTLKNISLLYNHGRLSGTG